MPLVPSNYLPPFWQQNGYVSTIYASKFRVVPTLKQKRERIVLPDNDFLDLDWSYCAQPKGVVVLLHGLEGNAQRPYITGAVHEFLTAGFDCCAVNLRNCSDEPNLLYRSYHSGATEDVSSIITHLTNNHNYPSIFLNGFSLGGNLALKYVGEGNNIPITLKGVVAISTPVDLENSLQQLLHYKNWMYAHHFKKKLVDKLRNKQQLFPKMITISEIEKIKTLKDFDDVYTSKAHGFKDAVDYYTKSSALQFLPQIRIPVLLINALNDSFLGKTCYPTEFATNSSLLHLETPRFGGHVGFYNKKGATYTEKRAVNFIETILS